MRVISGKYRGIKLHSADEKELRPMLDRVKESLFNILRSSLEESLVLDLFSGSGALGIEALSRGAAGCVFVERSRTLARLIERNIATCGIEDGRVRVICCSADALRDRSAPAGMSPADMVFVDPPYAMTSERDTCTELFTLLEGLVGDWISHSAIMMLHHAPSPDFMHPSELFSCYDRRIYGRSRLSFFEVRKDEECGASGAGDGY